MILERDKQIPDQISSKNWEIEWFLMGQGLPRSDFSVKFGFLKEDKMI